MKKFSKLAAAAAAAAFAALLAGCASAEKRPQKDGELAGTYWKPEGSPRFAYIEFTGDGRMVGNAGINRFFGPVVYAKGKRIRLGPLAATRNSGPENKYEELFFSRIDETRGYVLDGDILTLYNEDRKPVMKLFQLKVRRTRP